MSCASRAEASSNSPFCLTSLYKDLEDQSYEEIASMVMKALPLKRTEEFDENSTNEPKDGSLKSYDAPLNTTENYILTSDQPAAFAVPDSCENLLESQPRSSKANFQSSLGRKRARSFRFGGSKITAVSQLRFKTERTKISGWSGPAYFHQ